MAKNLYVKGCGTGKSRDSLLSFRYIFVLGLLVLMVSLSWLSWTKSELPVQLKSFTRNKLIRPISPARAKKSMSVSLHVTERDGLQGIAVAGVQEAKNSTPENDYVKQGNEIKGNYAVESSVSRSHEKGFVIQVGAFRSLARAQNLRKALHDEGYDAYLDTSTLPDHGRIYRVRIRGYTSLGDVESEMERLHKEEGLDSFALTGEPNLPMSGRK